MNKCAPQNCLLLIFVLAKVKDFSFLSGIFTLLWSKTHRPALIAHLWYPFFFSTCQDTFSAALLTASSSQGEEPLTSPQIWLVAKIRPVRELKSSLQLHWPGKSWPAGLYLRLSVSRRKRWKNNQGRLAWSYLPLSAALQYCSCLQSVWMSLIPVNYMLN